MAFETRSQTSSISQINVVPLVDVMLVLLVIFMVAAPILQQGVSVELPQAKAGALTGRWRGTRRAEPALSWMIVASAVIHALAGIALLIIPRELFARTPAPVVAYTVKIVDANALGGRLPKGEIKPQEQPSGVSNP